MNPLLALLIGTTLLNNPDHDFAGELAAMQSRLSTVQNSMLSVVDTTVARLGLTRDQNETPVAEVDTTQTTDTTEPAEAIADTEVAATEVTETDTAASDTAAAAAAATDASGAAVESLVADAVADATEHVLATAPAPAPAPMADPAASSGADFAAEVVETTDADLPAADTTVADVADIDVAESQSVKSEVAIVVEDDAADVDGLAETAAAPVELTESPELRQLTDSWPQLSDQTRAAILMLIEADQLTQG